MSKYRRTIITLDDTQSGKDYMLLAIFEKLWPDMQNLCAVAIHKIHKGVDGAGRFNVGVHVDEVDIQVNVEDDPLPHVRLHTPVDMLWGDIHRDPDQGVAGFRLKKDHEDLDSITTLLPQTESVQEVWGWFDIQRQMFKFLEANNISLSKIGACTRKTIGLDLSEHEFHIGCIYVVHYSPIKSVHIETIPMMPAVRCEIDWRDRLVEEDIIVKVRERVIDKTSIPHVFTQTVNRGNRFALVQMNSRPNRIDIDLTNMKGERLFFLRNIAFISTISIGKPQQTPKKNKAQRSKKAIGLEHYLRPVILKNEAIEQERKMEFVFFDGDPQKKSENKKRAKGYIEKMISRAEKKIVIADPYFSKMQFDEYIALLEDSKLDICIVNCKEQLEEVARRLSKARETTVTWQDVVNEIRVSVENYNGKGKVSKVTVYVIQGQGRLHDRFVMTETEGWMIGSSLSEFGNRACCIVKLSDSAMQQLNELVSTWCEDRAVSDKIV